MVGESKRFGLLHGSLQRVAVNHRGQVEEGASRRGDRYAVDLGDLVGTDARPMGADALPCPKPARHGHFDPDRVTSPDSPERGRGSVAQHRDRATGQDRCHPRTRAGQASPPDAVNPVVDRMQPHALQAVLNSPSAQAETGQLGVRHHCMLPVRELGNEEVWMPRGIFDSYVMSDIPLAAHESIIARRKRQRTARV